MASQGPEKGDEIMHCHEAKLTRAIGKEAKYPTTQKTTDFPEFKILASRCCAAAQEKLNDQFIIQIKRVCVFSEIFKTVNQSKHSEKNVVDSLISQKDHFSSVLSTFAASFCLAEDLHRSK